MGGGIGVSRLLEGLRGSLGVYFSLSRIPKITKGVRVKNVVKHYSIRLPQMHAARAYQTVVQKGLGFRGHMEAEIIIYLSCSVEVAL